MRSTTQQQALRIDDNVTLAPRYLLAGIVAVAAPFTAHAHGMCVNSAPALDFGSRVRWRTVRRKPFDLQSRFFGQATAIKRRM